MCSGSADLDEVPARQLHPGHLAQAYTLADGHSICRPCSREVEPVRSSKNTILYYRRLY